MTTTNISQSSILSYLVSTFQYLGINYISEQTIKYSKKDKPEVIYQMKILLFHLSLLHIFDYQIQISDLFSTNKLAGGQKIIKQSQLDELILAYLSECQCPFLVQLKGQQQNKPFIGCNLESSRSLLLLCGWVMAVSDYFNQILNKVILKRQKAIQNPIKKMPKFVQEFSNKNQAIAGPLTELSETEKIMQLYKSVQARQYNVQCLKQKKQKIIKRLDKQLKKYNQNLTIYDLMSSSKQNQEENNALVKKQKELKNILANQIQNMKQRKYFWIWLDQKILKQAQNDVIKNNQAYQKLQYSNSGSNNKQIQFGFQIDLNYLQKYMQLCTYYEQKYNQLSQKLDSMKLVSKKYKQLQSQVTRQINETLNKKIEHNKKHLFIALQLKAHLNIKQQKAKDQKQINKDKDQQQKSKIALKQNKKKLKQSLTKYLSQIQDAVKFI